MRKSEISAKRPGGFPSFFPPDSLFRSFRFFPDQRGLTLIEVAVGLVVVSVLVVTFGVALVAAVFAQNVKLRNLAHALADVQLSVLQTYASSSLPVQSGGPLIGVLFPKGSWAVAADAAAPSSPRVFGAAPVGSSGLTSLMPLPKNAYNDFAFSAKMKAAAGSPSGWRMGLLFRAADERNGYQLYLTSTSLVLKKIVNGAETTLYSDARSVSTDSWQTLGIVTNGSGLDVTLNGSTVTTVSDGAFSIGKAALAAWNGAAVSYDDAAMTPDGWNFDSVAVGAVPDDWLRFGLSSLPGGTATLTVEQLYGLADFKKASAVIRWNDSQGVKSLTSSVFIRN